MEKIKEVIEEIGNIGKKKQITEEDIDRLAKLVDGMYTKAVTIEEYEVVWIPIGQRAKEIVAKKGFGVAAQASVYYSGLFSGYYNLLKRLEAGEEVLEEEINGLMEETKELSDGIDKTKNFGLWINYQYLLSVEHSRLKVMWAITKAKKLDELITIEAKKAKDIVSVLKGINSSGLTAEKAGDYERAIEIFSRVEKDFSGSKTISEALQEYANCVNNRGNNKVKLSDREPSYRSKIDLLEMAIADFGMAENLYLRVVPEPPRKHIDGIINRVINASYRLITIEAEYSFESAGERIEQAFTKEKDRGKAIRIIREVYSKWFLLETRHTQILEILQRAESFLKE